MYFGLVYGTVDTLIAFIRSMRKKSKTNLQPQLSSFQLCCVQLEGMEENNGTHLGGRRFVLIPAAVPMDAKGHVAPEGFDFKP